MGVTILIITYMALTMHVPGTVLSVLTYVVLTQPIILPILKIRRLGHKEGKQLAQGHATN